MTTAHIGSVLPIRNRVLGIDENTAFLGHYDLNEHDVVSGVRATGASTSALWGNTRFVAKGPQYEIYTNLTLAAWIHPTATPTSDRGCIVIGKGAGGYYLTLTSGLALSAYWHNKSPAGYHSSVQTCPLNQWTHVAAVWSATELKLYINGNLDSTIAVTGTGARVDYVDLGTESEASRPFAGKVRDLSIWADSKEESVIRKMMANGIHVGQRGLRAYWKMDEGEGSILHDSSPFQQDVVIEAGKSLQWSTGDSVFTLRSQEGKFGGAIAVEEATTNLIPNPTVNAYPTIGNGWGTYQTNQYNSNTSFSIGTIESVIDNIVTLNPVGRPIYTYDVLNADTSGGGVVAGVEYFIKKHSENSFSLHAYDSSQDGSKGLRVHDSINNDVRIPISVTDFPTMWHGAPHRPNSGLVKEIIRNGFSSHGKKHDCLRLHTAHKLEGVVGDHMAYGVVPPIETGKDYTVSLYYRAVSPETVGREVTLNFYAAGTSFGGERFTLEKEWQRFSTSFNAPSTGSMNFYFHGGSGIVWDISEIQIENKVTATSFTQGSREVGRVNYPLSINPNIFTLNFWAKTPDSFYVEFIGEDDSNRMFFRPTSINQIGAGRVVNGVIGKVDPLIVEPINEWHMYTLVSEGSLMSVYQDGILKGQGTVAELEGTTKFFKLRREDGIAGGRNALFDEIRIDSVARTPEEIMAWYESQSPFWPRGIYRKDQ